MYCLDVLVDWSILKAYDASARHIKPPHWEFPFNFRFKKAIWLYGICNIIELSSKSHHAAITIRPVHCLSHLHRVSQHSSGLRHIQSTDHPSSSNNRPNAIWHSCRRFMWHPHRAQRLLHIYPLDPSSLSLPLSGLSHIAAQYRL